MISLDNYNFMSWKEKFPSLEIDFDENIILSKHWNDFMKSKREHGCFKGLEQEIANNLKYEKKVFPDPDLVFDAFDRTDLDDIKVVILGQDPYINSKKVGNKIVPQAIGSSFSVPIGCDIPPSLLHIFDNQKTYGFSNKQPHGNLTHWMNQGCFMLNSSLTVKENFSNSHSTYWLLITDRIIKHISDELNNIVFVLWGRNAIDKMRYIDTDKHKIIASSHPSAFSYMKPTMNYKPFFEMNHFGEINKYLIDNDELPISWQLF